MKVPDCRFVPILSYISFYHVPQKTLVNFNMGQDIHGRPCTVWQGALGISRKYSGYYPHSSMGWHRAYLSLYEVRYLISIIPELFVEIGKLTGFQRSYSRLFAGVILTG